MRVIYLIISILIGVNLCTAQDWGGSIKTESSIDTIYSENDSLKYRIGSYVYGFGLIDSNGASGSLKNDFLNLVDETISTDQHNRPLFAGTGAAFVVSGGEQDFTGMVAANHGDIFLIFNKGSGAIKFKHNNNNSTNLNRVFTPDNSDFKLQRNTAVYIRYDSSLGNNGRWHLIEARH